MKDSEFTASAEHIRPAAPEDACRMAEIEISNYRLNFYPIFRSDWFYFVHLQVPNFMERYEKEPELIAHSFVYDDGAVKGFVRINGSEAEKLFVEPVLQNRGIGSCLLDFAIAQGCEYLWPLELNKRAIALYERHGFRLTGDRRPEEGTAEVLVKMELKKG